MFKYFLPLSIVLLIAALLTGCDRAPSSSDAVSIAELPAGPDVAPPEGLLAAGAEWERVAEGYVYTDSPVGDAEGNVYYAEPIFGQVLRVNQAGEVAQVDANTEHTMGLVLGPDGYIYACRNHGAQIVRYPLEGEADASYEVLYEGEMTLLPNKPNAVGEFCNDTAVNSDGGIWFTDRVNRKIMYLDPERNLRVVAGGFRGNGIVLSTDRRMIVVTDSNAPVLHAFEIGEDGELSELEDYFDGITTVRSLGQEEIAVGRPGTNGMTVDADGRFYVASFYGVQVFGPDGTYLGVIYRPEPFISNLGFAGPDRDWLYASGREGLYRLKMDVRGVTW